jgi:hypothetical protein
MMKLLSKLFGSDKIIDHAANGIDKIWFTKEEKAENWINTLKAYEPFKLAQRLIALLVTTVYLFVWIVSVTMFVCSFWFEGTLEISKELAVLNNETLGLSFALIIGFYFAGGAAEGVVDRIKKKQTK